MLKKILLLLLFTTIVNAQHTITGTMQPKDDFKWMILYQLQGAKQRYIANTDVINGAFSFTLPSTAENGIYRMVYDLQQQLFVDVIYNNEDITFTFHPTEPTRQIQFLASEENKIYHQYLNKISESQRQLDSLQVAYFNVEEKDSILKPYQNHYKNLKIVQQNFEVRSKDKLAYHFIKASTRFTAEKPIDNPQAYLKNLKTHFFDFIDFNDPKLINSTFINDKINDYIFYINTSEDLETNNKLQQEAVSTVIDKIGDQLKLAKDIEEGLLYTFTQQQNVPLVNYVLENYYEKLPANYQDIDYIDDIKSQIKTIIGNKAPNILWDDNNIKKDLYSLTKSKHYVVVFWSSSCGHCLKEMPNLYEYLKSNNETKVIAVGLEEDSTKLEWEGLILDYTSFINVYGANKWQNKFSRAYGVNSTPSFFILDADKKIISKPDDVEELKSFFEKIK